MKFDLASLRAAYSNGGLTPADVVRESWRRIREYGESPVWIHLIPEEESIARAEALGSFGKFGNDLPLYGIPFAIKDNIDLAGAPTTAGCPDYAYLPNEPALSFRVSSPPVRSRLARPTSISSPPAW